MPARPSGHLLLSAAAIKPRHCSLWNYHDTVAVQSETLQVSGIRCERCVMRLGGVLKRLDGIESANANLMGQLALAYDDTLVDRASIVGAIEAGGFKLLDGLA